MNISCDKCGGKNTLPKGKTTMFCAFCGNGLEAPLKETITKVSPSRKGSDKENVLEYIRGGSKSKLNLPMADLKGIHLKGANLEGANLSGANLRNSCFDNANLKNANLKDTNLVNSSFTKADLSGANLCGAVFRDDEYEADFRDANLTNAVFKNSEISYDFRKVKSLKGANFSGCNMNGSCLDGVNLEDAKFVGAYLNSSIGHANLSGADLSDIISGEMQDIGKKEKHGARLCLSNSNLTKANLKNAQLFNAQLQDADLSEADLSSADLRGADFVKEHFNSTTQSYFYTSPANFKKTNLCGSDLRFTKLIGVDLSTANLQGANIEGALLNVPIEKKSKGCYLTTACVEAMLLPDDCHELQMLRKFRDGYVSEIPSGQFMINEYYEIAPKIIDAIYATGKSSAIFRKLYSDIQDIVSLIEDGKYEVAVKSYVNLTLNLKQQYLN
jgi:uncharacterized protein YjbI with pentapeptide repeats